MVILSSPAHESFYIHRACDWELAWRQTRIFPSVKYSPGQLACSIVISFCELTVPLSSKGDSYCSNYFECNTWMRLPLENSSYKMEGLRQYIARRNP